MKQDTSIMIDRIIDDRKQRSRDQWPDLDPYPFVTGVLSEMIGMTLDKFPDARAFFIDQFSVKPETQTK
jgi:hypothetical protein